MTAKRKARSHAWALRRDGIVRKIHMFKDEAVFRRTVMRRIAFAFRWDVARIVYKVTP